LIFWNFENIFLNKVPFHCNLYIHQKGIEHREVVLKL